MQKSRHLPEKELLTLLQEGNNLAFKQLYTQYYRQVHHRALRFSQCSDLARDITQDVFLKIWENRKRLAEVKCMNAYLLTMCKNRSLTIRAKSDSEQRALQQLAAENPQFVTYDSVDSLAEYRLRMLDIAIENLPPRRRRIFSLCKLEHKSYQEVAKEANLSPGTINDHIVKATRAIRKFLYLCGSFQET